MNRSFIIITVLASLAVLAACSSTQEKKHAARGPMQIIYSPTGDPLNGGPLDRPTCAEAMKHWFARADANHDGVVTLDEFLNDAKAQFQRMDIDKNGYLVSEELERFRMAYRDYSAGEKPAAPAGEQESSQPSGGHHGRGHHGDEGNGNPSGEGGNNGSVIDPVMSADTNLDYKVTPDEFMAYSRKTFTGLDTAHNGKLILTEVTTALCGDQSHDKH